MDQKHPIHRSSLGALFAVAALASTARGCSDDRGDGRGFLGGQSGVVLPCPDTTIACPDSGAPPTYTNDVAPILDAHCTGCHGPGGENNDVPLTSYEGLLGIDPEHDGGNGREKTAIANIRSCQMPPPPLPRLTAAEITTFACWFLGGRHR